MILNDFNSVLLVFLTADVSLVCQGDFGFTTLL